VPSGSAVGAQAVQAAPPGADEAARQPEADSAQAGEPAGGHPDVEPAPAQPQDAGPAAAQPQAEVGEAQDSTSRSVRVVPGIARYHTEDCILIRFLAADDLEIMSIEVAAEDGYAACKACKPDQARTEAAAS